MCWYFRKRVPSLQGGPFQNSLNNPSYDTELQGSRQHGNKDDSRTNQPGNNTLAEDEYQDLDETRMEDRAEYVDPNASVYEHPVVLDDQEYLQPVDLPPRSPIRY